MSKNHKIVNLMVFCLAAAACINCKEQRPEITGEQKSSIGQPPKEFDWDEATIIDAFNAGKIYSLDDFVKKAPHITDTVIINKDNYKSRICAGIYLPGEDKVHLKCFIPDLTGCTPQQAKTILASVRKWNDEVLKMADKAHESHHRQVHKKGVFSLPNSAEDYAKLCAHNEISAYTNTLLYEREIVKRAIAHGVPPEVWRKIISSRFGEYWDVVEKGEVRLDNILLNDERKDNLLISTTVFNWWMKNEYDKNVHICRQRITTYLDKNKWAINYPHNSNNYEKALNICYTFLKDGKLVNLNRYYKKNMMMVFGLSDFPFGTKYSDIDNQPEVKELIVKIRNIPGNMLYDNKAPQKFIKKNKNIKNKSRGR